MKIWILRPLKECLWEPWYDKAFGFIVAAESEEEARTTAQKSAGDEGEDAWTDSLNSTCIELSAPEEAGIIMRDFAAA